jgi:ACS family hexuronate transporter-like MFS transporter
MLYLHRYTFGLIKPKLQEEFGWSSTELGLLDGAFSFCYSVFQVPAGILADLAGARVFLVASIALWSLALGLVALAPDLAWMRVARAAFGASQSGCYAALSRVTRRWFPLSVRTTVQGVMAVFCGRLGGVSANLVFASFLIGVLQFRWQTAIYLLASAGLALALGFLVRSPTRHNGTPG